MSAAYWVLGHWGPLALTLPVFACWWAVRSIDTTGADEHTDTRGEGYSWDVPQDDGSIDRLTADPEAYFRQVREDATRSADFAARHYTPPQS